ncbi:MetQ/NlpA family ABC transporter substrate-binding protein [Caulobacter mirabilis]|uniref:Lipoprotein n=1 Tax=Caulobacter mirabilis TaxID=69666 RepID=A0A2D2B2U3_9CAUL|nr:MetQ/NlpA family ABC transporter substrate-binding protein [Caulobacter mirabilis]ATQ44558.1 methionine ABC transporter substrate-binding protein [Caulobacter mirabilis]
MLKIDRRLLVLAAAAAALAACGPKPADKPAGAGGTLTVAATAVPHAEILEQIKPLLAKQGITLQVKVFNDYVQPNLQVDQKQLDANYFQTLPYLDEFNKDRGTRLVPIVGVHIEPLGAYSAKYRTTADIPSGATVGIPNEASNGGRALLLLAKSGLITLKDTTNPLSTVKDIIGNPKGLKFKELESATLPRVLNQLDLALINTNYALDAKLNPAKDALFIEDSKSPYVNYLVAREDNKDDPRIKALAAALTSPQVKTYIDGAYKGAVVPAF